MSRGRDLYYGGALYYIRRVDVEPHIEHYTVRWPWRVRWLLWKGRVRAWLRFVWAVRGRPSAYRELRAAEREHKQAIERAFLFGD